MSIGAPERKVVKLDSFTLPDPPVRCRCGHTKFFRLGTEADGHVTWYFVCRACGKQVRVSELLILN